MNTLLRLSLAMLLLLGGVTSAGGAAAIPVVAHDMKLLRSKGRVWKHSEGWLARMIARGETVEAEFGLPQKLTAGQYYCFVKANNGGATLRMSCGGGGSAESGPVDNDGNGLWSDPIPITVATPGHGAGPLAAHAVDDEHVIAEQGESAFDAPLGRPMTIAVASRFLLPERSRGQAAWNQTPPGGFVSSCRPWLAFPEARAPGMVLGACVAWPP